MIREYFLLILLLSTVFVSANEEGLEAEDDESDDESAAIERRIIEAGVRNATALWERGFSGFPVNCRKLVDLMADDGVVEMPAAYNVLSGGHRRIYVQCERLKEHFTHIETFITSPLHITKYNVAFERASLMVTKTNCRMVSKAITTILYDKNFKIKVLKDYFNVDEFLATFESCQFPKIKTPKNTEKEGGNSESNATENNSNSEKKKDEL